MSVGLHDPVPLLAVFMMAAVVARHRLINQLLELGMYRQRVQRLPGIVVVN